MLSLQESLSKLYCKLGIDSERTKNIANHLGWTTFFKAGSIVSNFLLVPLTIDYLEQETYGIWLTLSTFIGWFSFVDIGLGHGLRNKFAEAKTAGDYKLARAYVSCAYYTIGLVCICLVVGFYAANYYIDWTRVFNTSAGLQDQLSLMMPIIMAFFGLQLVAKLITTIYTADQHHSIQAKVDFFTRIISLLVIFILIHTVDSSLLLFGVLFSALPVLVLIILNFVAFNATYKDYRPSFKLFRRRYLKDITGVGLNFFVIQIGVIILFSTDNFIISKLFGPENVVPYNIAFKYFSLITMAHTILSTPYWSSFTEAYANEDYHWIKRSVGNIQKIWLIIPAALVMMLILANWFYRLWVGEEVVVPFALSVSMAFYALLITFSAIYIQFMNGVGKIRLQLIITVVSMVINIPLSILLAKTFNMGLSGVILATCFSLVLGTILWPLQYHKIINGKAKGIWGK
ncbi:MAG: MATE family efflux transporter [Leeuwenhoekiella sp.]